MVWHKSTHRRTGRSRSSRYILVWVRPLRAVTRQSMARISSPDWYGLDSKYSMPRPRNADKCPPDICAFTRLAISGILRASRCSPIKVDCLTLTISSPDSGLLVICCTVFLVYSNILRCLYGTAILLINSSTHRSVVTPSASASKLRIIRCLNTSGAMVWISSGVTKSRSLSQA